MSETTFLELLEGVGPESAFIVDPKSGLDVPNPKAGEPAPLTSVGVKIPFPTMVGKDVAEEQRTAEIVPLPEIDPDWKARPVKDDTQVLACARIIPGTRIVETNAPPIVAALLASHWQECDPPKQDTKARQAAGKTSDEKAGE
jgi:hypothetical protein